MLPVFGMPILVAALEAQPPVQVAACDVSVPIREPNMGTDRGTTVEGTYSLHVRFAGAVAQPISRVIFALSDGTNVVDVGHFAPNTTIDHTFGLASTSADSCKLVSATFADGTQWSANTSTVGRVVTPAQTPDN